MIEATHDLLPSKLRALSPCPACGVRAMTGYVGARIQTCENCGAASHLDDPLQPPPPVQQPPLPQPVVYYLRFADRVKIGTTRNLTRRMESIPYDELLATEPGGYDLEKSRHRQFHSARIYANREWFWLTDELRIHIAGLARG